MSRFAQNVTNRARQQLGLGDRPRPSQVPGKVTVRAAAERGGLSGGRSQFAAKVLGQTELHKAEGARAEIVSANKFRFMRLPADIPGSGPLSISPADENGRLQVSPSPGFSGPLGGGVEEIHGPWATLGLRCHLLLPVCLLDPSGGDSGDCWAAYFRCLDSALTGTGQNPCHEFDKVSPWAAYLTRRFHVPG